MFPPPEKLFTIRDSELPFFEGSLPSCLPHSAGYTRTFVHPYFPISKIGFFFKIRTLTATCELEVQYLLSQNRLRDSAKFLDYQRHFVIFYCRGVSQAKQRFGTIFLCAPRPLPLKITNYIFIVASPQ